MLYIVKHFGAEPLYKYDFDQIDLITNMNGKYSKNPHRIKLFFSDRNLFCQVPKEKKTVSETNLSRVRSSDSCPGRWCRSDGLACIMSRLTGKASPSFPRISSPVSPRQCRSPHVSVKFNWRPTSQTLVNYSIILNVRILIQFIYTLTL